MSHTIDTLTADTQWILGHLRPWQEAMLSDQTLLTTLLGKDLSQGLLGKSSYLPSLHAPKDLSSSFGLGKMWDAVHDIVRNPARNLPSILGQQGFVFQPEDASLPAIPLNKMTLSVDSNTGKIWCKERGSSTQYLAIDTEMTPEGFYIQKQRLCGQIQKDNTALSPELGTEYFWVQIAAQFGVNNLQGHARTALSHYFMQRSGNEDFAVAENAATVSLAHMRDLEEQHQLSFQDYPWQTLVDIDAILPDLMTAWMMEIMQPSHNFTSHSTSHQQIYDEIIQQLTGQSAEQHLTAQTAQLSFQQLAALTAYASSIIDYSFEWAEKEAQKPLKKPDSLFKNYATESADFLQQAQADGMREHLNRLPHMCQELAHAALTRSPKDLHTTWHTYKDSLLTIVEFVENAETFSHKRSNGAAMRLTDILNYVENALENRIAQAQISDTTLTAHEWFLTPEPSQAR